MRLTSFLLIFTGCASTWASVTYTPAPAADLSVEHLTRLIRTSRDPIQPDKIEVDPAYVTFFYVNADGIKKDTVVFAKLASFDLVKKVDSKSPDRIVYFRDSKDDILFVYYAVDEHAAKEFIDVIMTLAGKRATTVHPAPP